MPSALPNAPLLNFTIEVVNGVGGSSGSRISNVTPNAPPMGSIGSVRKMSLRIPKIASRSSGE